MLFFGIRTHLLFLAGFIVWCFLGGSWWGHGLKWPEIAKDGENGPKWQMKPPPQKKRFGEGNFARRENTQRGIRLFAPKMAKLA